MRILAILAEEEEYADELSLYIRQHKECGFTPIVFTRPENYLKFTEEESDSCLLADEVFMGAVGEAVPKERMCLLLGSREPSSKGIYKYRSAEALTKDLTEWFGNRQPGGETSSEVKDEHRSEKGCLITYFSPDDVYISGRAALRSAYERGTCGSTLLISFDPFCAFGTERDTGSRMSLSDIIFMLREGKAGEELITDTLRRGNSRIDVLCGVNSWMDIYDTAPKDITGLLRLVRSLERYDTVIVDMSVLGAPGLTLMEESERIVIVSKDNGGDESRTEEWRRQMRALGREDILRKAESRKEGGPDT